MIIENITNKGISLDRNGQSMQREVYEREIVKLQSNWNSLREWLENSTKQDAFMYNFTAIKVSEILDKMNELEGKGRNENE